MSAKMRLSLWVTSMVLLLSIMVLVFVLVINRHTLPEDPQQYLVDTVLKNANSVEFDRGRFEWDDLDVYRRGVYCSFYDENGNLQLSGNTDDMDFTEYPFEDNVTRTIEVGGVEYYIYDKYVDMSITGLWVRGVTRTDSHYGIMDTIVRLTIIMLPILLIVTFLGALLISTLSFRPMEKIVATANSINDADDLTDRINMKRGPREMRKLANSFDTMFERLEKLFDSERQFTSDASHELRTPTAIILAECERARRKELSTDEYAETIEHIEEQGQRMNQLIDELLGITRLQQGTEKYPLAKSDLSEFVMLCAEEFTPADDREIRFREDIEEGIEVNFNASLVSRVVYNYLQNAYKYGRDNGNVKLSLKKDGEFAVLAVKDDGIGISEENIGKIWNRFWQADSSRGSEGGSGLGLSMVKGIAELHGGSVSVESKLGEGSTFYFKLPLASV